MSFKLQNSQRSAEQSSSARQMGRRKYHQVARPQCRERESLAGELAGGKAVERLLHD